MIPDVNIPVSFVEYDEVLMGTIMDSIAEDSCVVFLGPLFGEDNQGAKISKRLWDYFDKTGPKVDDDFQNLFIRKNQYDDPSMAFMIKKFYMNICESPAPDRGSMPIYRNVAKIGFSAFVAFGQDNFLRNTFDEHGFEYVFQYYSTKGPDTNPLKIWNRDAGGTGDQQRRDPSDLTGVPVIFNCYGKITDPRSLITNYDTYYQFLFAILSDRSFFSPELHRKLGSARVCIFLGFDLKKWYVPILFQRINTYLNPGFKPILAASLNDTDVSNNEYVKWLQRYPLGLKRISSTVSFLETILETANNDKAGILRTPARKPEITNRKCSDRPDYADVAAQWRHRLETADADVMLAMFGEMIHWFEEKSCKNEQIYMIMKKASLFNAMEKHSLGLISDEAFDIAVARIRFAVVKFLTP